MLIVFVLHLPLGQPVAGSIGEDGLCPLWVISGLLSQHHFMSALLPKADISPSERAAIRPLLPRRQVRGLARERNSQRWPSANSPGNGDRGYRRVIRRAPSSDKVP